MLVARILLATGSPRPMKVACQRKVSDCDLQFHDLLAMYYRDTLLDW